MAAGEAGIVVGRIAKANLTRGVLLRRYKRFLGDIELEDGTVETVHVPNTGPMIGLLDTPRARVLLETSPNPKRKYPKTLVAIECVEDGKGSWVCVDSARANKFVSAALELNLVEDIPASTVVNSEVKVGGSRLDFELIKGDDEADVGDGVFSGGKTKVYMEVKAVTLVDYDPMDSKRPENRDVGLGDGLYQRGSLFPDTVSVRAQKHVDELTSLLSPKVGGVAFFLVMRSDATSFRACARADPRYATLVEEARAKGLHTLAYSIDISEDGEFRWKGPLPVLSPYKHDWPAPTPGKKRGRPASTATKKKSTKKKKKDDSE